MTREEMTREEAISELNTFKVGAKSELGEIALCMAIKALEQEPCEDAISRKAVIDGINEYFHDEYHQRTSIQDCKDCFIEDVIKSLPPVEPQWSNMGKYNDVISRQAAIDAILHNQEVYSNNLGDDPIDKYTIAIIDNDAQTIAQLPSVQPNIDRIRAEIERQRKEASNKSSEDDGLSNYYFGLNDGLKDARDILDKYKEEERVSKYDR